MRRFMTSAAMCCLLSACGGGDGSSGVPIVSGPVGSAPTPTPSPPSTPTPSPPATPSPAPTAEVSLILPPADAVVTSATLDFVLTGNEVANKTSDWVTTQPAAAFALNYNASTSTFLLADDQRSRSFDPSQIFSDSSYRDGLPSRQYGQNTLSNKDFLVVFKGPLANVTQVSPKYGAYGAWQHNEGTSPVRIRLDYFTYGSPTPVAAMPRSGQTTFRVIGSGNHTDAGGLFFTQTNTLFTVDWSTGKIIASVLVTGSDFLRDSTGGVNAFTISGTVAGNGSQGSLFYGTGIDRPGQFTIRFYGPNADELALVYTTTNQYGGEVGVALGTRQ